jgi:uncharacterized membrane protein YphA (DoxX/SURF4 family)
MMANILAGLLAVIFAVSGISKISGTAAGLSGTRELQVPDSLAKLIGLFELVCALGIIWGLRYPQDKFGWLAAVGLWCTMLGAIYVHFQRQKRRTAFPAGFLLILITILLVIKQ